MYKNKKGGFSLAEMVVVIGILGLIFLVTTSFQFDVFRNNQFGRDSLTSAQDARGILRVIVKELRSVSTANDGSFAISQAATNTLAFYSDTDGDGIKEKIRYFVATTTLKKGSIKPTGDPLVYNPSDEVFSILSYNIRNATSTALFEYYDGTYAGTSSPMTQPVTVANIHLIKINLMIDVDPNKSPAVRSYTSQVSLRNLKDNL